MNDLIAKLIIGTGFLGVIYGFYFRYQQAMQKIAQAEAQAKIKTDLEKVAADAVNVKETDRDYSNLRDEFLKNNPK